MRKKTFVAYSRKNALKDIAGKVTYYAARTAGILKYPEIIHIEGKITLKGDTTVYFGTLTRYNDLYQFTVKTCRDTFEGKIVDEKGRAKLLQGEKITSGKPLRNYPALIDKAFSMTEKYYFDKNLVNLSEWQDFKENVADIKSKIVDDYELNAVIYWYRKKLPLPKYEIQKKRKGKNGQINKNSFDPKEIKPATILINLNNIPQKADDINHFFEDIQDKHCANLIIDMRGRKKVQMSQALFLAGHLANHSALWGIYLTQKGSNNFNPLPNPAEYEKVLADYWQFSGTNAKLYRNTGFYMRTKPDAPSFEGKIYVLTDQKTSGVAEALTIFLKKENIAITVGQKTSGSPMFTEAIPISNDYFVSIQVAQFYDKSGRNYINKGTEPDIEVIDEDILSLIDVINNLSQE